MPGSFAAAGPYRINRGTVTGFQFFKTEAPSPHGFILGGLLKAAGGALVKALGPKPAAPSTALTTSGITIPGIPKGSPADKLIKATYPFAPSELVKGAFGAGTGRRRRRMNPLNLRALTRADRRLTKFSKIARRYVARNAPQRRVRAFGRKK